MSDRTKHGPTPKRPQKNSGHIRDMKRREYNKSVGKPVELMMEELAKRMWLHE